MTVVSVDPRTPCIIGVAQRTWHLDGVEWAPEPLEMQAEVVTAAAADATASGDVLAAVDGLDVVHCMSWPYDDPAARLAERVGMEPRRRNNAGMGGTMPQELVDTAASRIIRGESDVEVVVGAEALDTKRRMRRAGERASWSHRHPDPPGFPFEAPFHPTEVAHEVFQAWLTFAVRDIARRARRSVAPEPHRLELGELLAPFTAVAASNPHAWFPTVRTPRELVTPTSTNRMVGYPYTKTMVAVMDVDMAAAVMVSSWQAADRLGVPTDRRVPLQGWCFATDPTYLAEHRDLSRSPAMAEVFDRALAGAGLGVDDVDQFDLYSCFASSVDFARDALGLAPQEARALTVTGGLPYAGGPASNYMSHAITSMIVALRADPGSVGMVSGVGMHMTKHVAAVYGGDPAAATRPPAVEAHVQASPEMVEPLEIRDTVEGTVELAGYSVVHGRDGGVEWGLGVVDCPGGGRSYVRCEDADVLASWEREEWVGRSVDVRSADGINRVVG